MQKKLLAVDDEPNNLRVLGQILRDRYEMTFASSGEEAIEAATEYPPDLILLDIMMPGMNGYEVCETLKASPSTREIPVIFVTAMGEVEDEARGFDAGAVDYIQKPVSASILRRRVETHLSLVRMHELEESHRQAVFMLGEAGHYNDTDTGTHNYMAYGSLCLCPGDGGRMARPSGAAPRTRRALARHRQDRHAGCHSQGAARADRGGVGDHATACQDRFRHPEQVQIQDIRNGRGDRPSSP